MTTNLLVTFYSTYGHVHRMALAVAEGAESVPDTTVRLRRIAELEEARKALSAQDAYVRAQHGRHSRGHTRRPARPDNFRFSSGRSTYASVTPQGRLVAPQGRKVNFKMARILGVPSQIFSTSVRAPIVSRV